MHQAHLSIDQLLRTHEETFALLFEAGRKKVGGSYSDGRLATLFSAFALADHG